MLDLTNYKPPVEYKCKDCAYYMREANDHSKKITLRCQKKPFYVAGYISWHKTKANNPACRMFKKADDFAE